MATFIDREYLRALIERRLVSGRVLEIGAANWQEQHTNLRSICEAGGLTWEGADIEAGAGLTLTLDLLDDEGVARIEQRWDSVIVFNVLEHVYDPPAALTNALRLVQPGGTCAVVTPTVWQLHDYPGDYWRPLPDFYEEFARRHRVTLVPESYMWLSANKLFPRSAFVDGSQKLLPSIESGALLWGRRRHTWSRVVHKLGRTTGRVSPYPLSCLGLVLRKPQ